MRLYVEFAKNAFQANIAYRAEVILRIFTRILFIFVQVSIWRALFSGLSGTSTNYGTITLKDMITYTIVSTMISIIVDSSVIERIDEKVKTGEIAMDLIKPMNFKGCIFCETLGKLSFRIIFELIPALIMSSLLFGLHLPSVENVLLFFVAIINAFVLYFLISYILGLIAFWYITVWQLGVLFRHAIMIVSGSFIPLWFFPNAFVFVSGFLPFRLIYFAPITIYLGKEGVMGAMGLILQQFIWIGILLVVERLLWVKGTKKLVVQGG